MSLVELTPVLSSISAQSSNKPTMAKFVRDLPLAIERQLYNQSSFVFDDFLRECIPVCTKEGQGSAQAIPNRNKKCKDRCFAIVNMAVNDLCYEANCSIIANSIGQFVTALFLTTSLFTSNQVLKLAADLTLGNILGYHLYYDWQSSLKQLYLLKCDQRIDTTTATQYLFG